MIESHFWIEIPLKLDNQVIQIKTLVCDSECPDDIVLGHTSLAPLSAWQDYASKQLKTEQNIFCPTPYNYWKRHCIH